MAVTYGFFNSINGDRKYNADQMSDYFRGIVNQGVFQHLDNGLAVVAGTGMEVTVATGRAIVQNKWVQNDAAFPLTIEAASDTYGRKDAVVIRLSYTNRAISIVVKTGTPSASPAAPSLTRSSTTYEMALAYVNVSAGATSVTVTDKRSDTTVCGWATVAQETSGEVDAMLEALKTGFDGVEYPSPVAMVQGCDEVLQNEIDLQKNLVFTDENLCEDIQAFSENNVTGTYNSSTGCFTFNGTASDGFTITDFFKVRNLKKNTTYFLKAFSYDSGKLDTNSATVRIVDATTTVIGFRSATHGETFTTSSNIENIHFNIYIGSGASFNNATMFLMIVEGSKCPVQYIKDQKAITKKDIDYMAEWFNEKNQFRFVGGFTEAGITLAVNNKNHFAISGTSTAAFTSEMCWFAANLKANTIYTMKLYNIVGSGMDTNSVIFYLYNAGSSVRSATFRELASGKTFTTPASIDNLRFLLFIQSGVTVNGEADIMFYEGEAAEYNFTPPHDSILNNKIEDVKNEVEWNIENGILYKTDEIVVQGTNEFVSKDLYFPYEGTEDFKFICDVEGNTASSPGLLYMINSSGTQDSGQWIRQDINGKYSITSSPVENIKYIHIKLYPAQGTVLPTGQAKYKNIVLSMPNAETHILDDKYFPVPSYYKSYIRSKIETINNYMNAFSANGLAFIFITDQHWNFNQQNSMSLIQAIAEKTNIPLLVSGGDTMDYGSFEYCKQLRTAFPSEIHHVAGNHDYFYRANVNSDNKLYNYFDTYADNQMTSDPGRHYYYWDDARKKVRFIVLSAFASGTSSENIVNWGYEADQLTWFENEALDAPTGYDIIVFTHAFYSINVSTDAVTVAHASANDFIDAIDNSGRVKFVFQGHTHRDRITATPGGVPVIITTCDKNIPYLIDNVSDIDVDRTSGTINEQAFDVVLVDRDTKKIHAVRIGAKAMNGIGDDPGSAVEERVINYT